MFKNLALSLIKIYRRYLRVFLPATCRFWPTCSEYASQAISTYGFCKGGLKAAKRLLSCHPFSGRSGYDPLL